MSGSQQRYTVPYSTVPLLQREGRFKYDVVAGDFRSGNSQQSSPFFFQGTLIAGLPEGYTAYGGTQLASRYTAVVLSTGRNLGDWGAVLSISPMRAANWRMTVRTRGSLYVSCMRNR